MIHGPARPARRSTAHVETLRGERWRNALLRRIWWPSRWWFDARYGVDGPVRRSWHRVIVHPATVLVSALDLGWWKYVSPILSCRPRHVEIDTRGHA
jgi:hypothetical protein